MSWTPRASTLNSLRAATRRLIDNIDTYLYQFDQATAEDRTFGGPSLYFHFKCISSFGARSVADNLSNTEFLETVYAVLATWGLHRMGRTATKLKNFGPFKTEIISQADRLIQLEHTGLWSIQPDDVADLLGTLTSVLDSMTLSKSRARLVANTKALHHILPRLIPPIDRRYTLRFFGLNEILPSEQTAGAVFSLLFPCFIQIASATRDLVQNKIDLSTENWHTSFTKVIDNAILGAFYSRPQPRRTP